MMKYSFLVLFFYSLMQAQPVELKAGRVVRISDFASKLITPRNVDVWLPDGYTESQKYDVLYMHDGQMLFDPESTWNKQAWEVDDIAHALIKSGQVKPFIVVGIWNNPGMRHQEYFPQKVFESMTAEQQKLVSDEYLNLKKISEPFKPVSDAYLKFIVTELKPYIDSHFSVFTDQSHTFIMGSSMGGLISMYAYCEYPKVFGGAACMSTHWTGIYRNENNPVPEAMRNYLQTHLQPEAGRKIYFDYGDQTLDSLYAPWQKKVNEFLKAKGFTPKNAMSQFFPGENHSEEAWKKRLDIPLTFLLGNAKQ